MSGCRIFFCLISFAGILGTGWFWDGGRPSSRAWLVVSLGANFIAASIWFLRRTARAPIQRWVLELSVTLDAAMCGAIFLGDCLWPTSIYAGSFRSLDATALLLTIVISGFRLSTRAVWMSIGLNTISAVFIRCLDITIHEQPADYRTWMKLAIYICSAGVLALIVARQTRLLAMTGAMDSLRAHRARQALGALLQDHHDLRSLISSANLNAESLRRGLDADHPHRVTLEFLRDDLRAVSIVVSTLRERALQALSSTERRQSAILSMALQGVRPFLLRRFSPICIESDMPDDLEVMIVGGATILERIFLNVMVNSCEGNGTCGASAIWLHAGREEGRVRLRVDDDGPGFPDSLLQNPFAYIATSKSEGTGLGLFLVQTVVAASDGALTLSHRPGGGARVEIVLPAVPS